jgi:hypothetical protein
VQEMVSGGIELIAGLSRQEPFGMGVVAGAGGVLVELTEDTALDLCPVDNAEALALIARTRAGRLLQGYRGRPCGQRRGVCRAPCASVANRRRVR